MSDKQPPKTARATAARRRASEERHAAHLRERGWTCTPPDEQPEQLRAVLRPSCLLVGPGDLVRAVDVVGSAGMMPRASTDPAVLRRRFAPADELLRRAGYATSGAVWTVGVDQRGPYAATWCRRVASSSSGVERVTFTDRRP